MTLLPVAQDVDGRPLLVDPATGEAHLLQEATEAVIARWFMSIRELEQQLRTLKAVVNEELAARGDRRGKWTWDTPEGKLAIASPAPVEDYDAQPLRVDLEELVARGILDPEAVDAAVHEVVDYKVRKAGINALAKLPSPEVQAVLDRHRQVTEPARRATVRRAA